ncbi:hypothetical protein AXK11_03345 [Cephaloticoccus primus]|uniref:DUF58 domain-containing protein n=1 Tax=Cephaloticoccus primus TaxID=1548207 RepID=A0A139SQJ4_9BACT|nr:hypothetical protein AXK11_03345 [Cephaloticoccus primus]
MESAAAILRRLEWRVRHAVENVLSGEYRSAFRGRGMEFDQVVRYEFGDDVRDIDWNVTARLGEPYRKKFVEERELTLLLLFEDSPSLNFGSGSKTKREALLELAGLLMLLGAVNRDRVGFIHSALDASGTPRLHFRAPVRGRGAILHSAAQLLALPPPTAASGHATEAAGTLGALGTALRQINRSRAVPKHSVLVWLGDFAPRAQPEGWPVIQRRFQTMGFRVDDPWERRFPAELGGGGRGGLLGGLPSGATLAAYDPLAGRLVTLEDSPAARAAHATWQREREEAWAALFPAAHNRLAVSTEDDQLGALVRFFHARMRLPH